MEKKELEYLDEYEQKLMQQMLRLATSMELLNGQLLETPDIADKWETIAQSYLPDGVKEIANYPTVAIGWMMYVGMAVAKYWDEDWEIYGQVPNLYEYIRDKRGFDYLDEVVRGEILMLKDDDYTHMEKVVQGFAQQVLNQIRHENIEPQSPMAFHVYVRSIKVLYQIGAAIELKALGYKFEMVAE